MANTTPSWRPMDGQLPITGAGLPLTAAFCPAPAGMLGIRLLSGGSFPGGQLVLIANSKSQTDHWLPGRNRDRRGVPGAHGGL